MKLPTSPAIQKSTHALIGGSSATARNIARNMLHDSTTYEEMGTALHYFGDSFAHSRMDNENEMYNPGWGHTFDQHDPDYISKRPALYLEYVKSLQYNLGSKLHSGTTDMFTFNYVANSGEDTQQNSAVFETEIRIREGAKSFSVAGNQVGAINNYLKARNGHYESSLKSNVVTTNVDIYKQNKKGDWEKTTENRTLVTFTQ